MRNPDAMVLTSALRLFIELTVKIEMAKERGDKGEAEHWHKIWSAAETQVRGNLTRLIDLAIDAQPKPKSLGPRELTPDEKRQQNEELTRIMQSIENLTPNVEVSGERSESA